MYLKSIEIQGFKSFANKILLEFHNGITGIVGPNGSGKSNVADAVRWVLGEQRAKQLRGASMQDVIFSGTELRKPLSYASVAITLDNSDHQLAVQFDEVTVTRRVYRSGESEYLINGAACRLKDINELFYDTGIGKEGYSIIGQGQIDKILSGKPEDRRELFDEAAGIVKFKRRKLTAQKQLDEERQNLVRVNDIIAELEKQKGPLEKQSETARIYLKKKEELKLYDVNFFLAETEKSRLQQKELEEKKKNASLELSQTEEIFRQTKAGYEEMERKIEELGKRMDEAREAQNQARLTRQSLESQIELLKEQINTARTNDEHIQNRMEAIRKDQIARTEELGEYETQKKEQDEKIRAAEEEQKEAEERLSDIRLKMEEENLRMDQAKADIIELLNTRASTKGKIQRYDTMLEQAQIRKAQLSSRILQLKTEEDEHKETSRDLGAQMEQVRKAIREFSEESEEYNRRQEELQKEIIRLNEKIEAGQTAFHREQSRLESLKNITERYDGYGNSIRRVMDQRGTEPGIIGVVADLIKVDKKYETAVETALGGSIQNIVTDTAQTAKRMIEFLKRTKGGRATFLPLTSVKNRQEFRQERVLGEPGVIGLASKLVETEPGYRELIGYLLGRTVVAETIDAAIALARKYNYSLRIVTVEGESLSPGGSMTGGAFKNSSNLLGRRREIEELEASVGLLKKDLEESQRQMDEQRGRRNRCREKIVALKEKLQEQYLKQNTLQMECRQAQEKLTGVQSEYTSLQKEGQEIEGQISDIGESLGQIRSELAASEQTEKELEQTVLSCQESLESRREEEEAARKVSEELHLQTAQLNQNAEFLSRNTARIRGELAQLEEEYKKLDENLDVTAEDIARKQEDIFKIRQTIEASIGAVDDREEEIRALTQEKEETNRSHREFFAKREELSEKMTRLDKEVFRLNAQYEKLEEGMDTQINYMWEEYGLTWSAARELGREDLGSISDIRKQITALKDEIRKLGDVNVNAIEDFKELTKRWEFLSGQRDDLKNAEETLLQIIQELDEGMRKQFKEQFAAICREFEKAFKELFGGGKASLSLMEDEDILESGIMINAQPPGKKLQNMMQLSGGEKALTAISLLFAIQNLKPSPFCLLDEIEAALDDSNVGRFADYLHKLTKNTQFIIITHRRGTMAAADRLYGITMQEKGVSALVSVDLIEHDLDK
ncbi:MAG: chromosome segregation protein SMC [Oscillospiraceae bacterium]|nr:chromosome segregation protein SMC [Oscillospiraceae bacterium]